MRKIKILGASLLALTAVATSATPAFAHHGHKVCMMEHHHGHSTRVCHWH